MSKPQRGLGKGLSALLGETGNLDQLRSPVGYVNKDVVGTKDPQDTADVLRIPVDMIEPNPFQPRMSFDQDALQELAVSIKTFGLIQPITVRKKSADRYQIISGERRFKACRIAGKKRASVTNYLRLLRLPAKIQHDLKVGLLSVGHAKVLLGVEDQALQEQLCDVVIKNGLSVRQLEDKIHELLKEDKPEQKRKEASLPDEYCRVLEHIGKFFDKSISLKRSESGKGTMTIHFDSDEEIHRFLKALDDSNI